MNFNFFKKFLMLFILSILLLCSCSQKSQKPSEGGKDEKPPQSLLQLEQNIETIIDSLDKEGRIEGKDKQDQSGGKQQSQGASSEGGGKSDKKQGGKEEGQQGSESGGQSQQGSESGGQSQTQATSSPWSQDDKIIKQILMQWNEFRPSAVKAGTTPQTIEGFDNTLNNLANDISVKNLMNTLNDANEAYKYIPDFLSHYKDKSVDIKRLKYFTREVMYKSRFDKWDASMAAMSQAKNLIPNLRSQSTEQTKDMYQSLEYGITDLEKVLNQKQKNLVQIKGNIVLENIKNIEQNIKNESQKKSQ